jgi:Uma2 family endonuclease
LKRTHRRPCRRRRRITNPAVAVEILSPSTEAYATGEKLRHYQQIQSLSHILLVAHDAIRIDVWTRTNADWTKKSYGPGDSAELSSVGCTLDVDGVFHDPLSA